MTADLAAFIAARLSEDERSATPGRQTLDDLRFELKAGDQYEQHLSSRIEDGLDAQTTVWEARVLREVAAGRLLLADYDKTLTALSAYENHPGEWIGTPEEWAETGVRLRHVADVLHRQVKIRATVHRDHPDYRPEWAPA